MQELTEAEQEVLHRGLRMLARMIARQHLANRDAVPALERVEEERPQVAAGGDDETGAAQ